MASAVPARAEPRASFTASPWLAPALLVAAVILAYANTLSSPFLFDDVGAVLENPTIRRIGSPDIFVPPADGSTTTGRPVVNATFALNYALSGEKVWSYHALNLAIHALAALTLLGLVRSTLRSPLLELKLPASTSAVAALAATALWALHPLNTESVTCIAQRTESLCGLFYLLTLYAFTRATIPVGQTAPGSNASTSTRWLVVSVLSCLLGMATKEVMVTAPVLVFLYDRTFVARSFSAAWRARRGYYLALVATWFLLGLLLALNAGARGASAGFSLGVTPWTYLLTQAEAVVLYLRLAIWPHPLVLDYGTAVVRSLVEVWWQGPVVLGLLAATLWALIRRPMVGFIGAWFFLILAPSSSVVPLVTQTIAEHRMYLPLAAVMGLLVVALHAWLAARGSAFRAVLILLTVAALTATIARNRDYRDGITVWTDTAAKRPANPRAHHNLALALHHAGRPAEAHPHFARAIALDPGYVTAHYNWAVALLAEARAAEALPLLAATVRLAPTHVDAHRQLALLAERDGRPGEVETHLTAVLRLVPDDLAAHRKLGLLLARAERLALAAEHFRAVIRLVPADADAHANLGNVLLLAGQPREAIAAYEAALRLRPGDPRMQENLRIARESLP